MQLIAEQKVRVPPGLVVFVLDELSMKAMLPQKYLREPVYPVDVALFQQMCKMVNI